MMQIDRELTSEMFVYRYLPFESFVAFMETGTTVLTNINRWDDKWEAILGKVPTLNEHGKPSSPSYSFHQDIFGQSWTLLDESDAMWRIYSPTQTGLQLRTSVGKFGLIRDVERSHVGRIVYFEGVEELMAITQKPSRPFGDALVKRAAFQHEREVRYLTNGQFLKTRVSITAPRVTLPLDPIAFIEAVTVDPRADDRHLETVIKYASRAGLRCTPSRSLLYEADPHLKIGVTRQYLPVSPKS